MTPPPTPSSVGRSRESTFSIPSIAPLLVHITDTDLGAAHAVGINLSACVVIVWLRGKAKVNRLLGITPLEARATRGSTHPLPYEIAELIIAHLTHDLRALKAFSLTCRSWYIVAVPHLHHTLTLAVNESCLGHSKLQPLSKLDGLGLMPLVKEIRVRQSRGITGWFLPPAFSNRDLRYFSAFGNVQTLVFQRLQVYRFIPGVERYFKHFSPTLRSITLLNSRCTPRQLAYFLSHFPNLEDIEIRRTFTNIPKITTTIPDAELVPFSSPKLRGRLTLYCFRCVETWTYLIVSCGGLRFRHMDLCGSKSCQPVLLEACAETLETLRFDVMDGSVGK